MLEVVCRFCGCELGEPFCDLGMQPLSNAFRRAKDLRAMERFYPLQAFVCSNCFLVQVEAFEQPEEIFTDYAYFSSYSSSWLESAKLFADVVTKRRSLGAGQLVVELGSNDGYLLQYFKAKGIGTLGIDPAANCAAVAQEAGIDTLVAFFGTGVAKELLSQGKRADLIVVNNVLAHVPDLNDFVAGIKSLLAPRGIASVEVPHLLKLIERTEYDTIYHEHFSYFSLSTAQSVFGAHGLQISQVEELTTHGGSIRMWVEHLDTGPVHKSVPDLVDLERTRGLFDLTTYQGFGDAVVASKLTLWEFLVRVKREGKAVAAYGAAAKGSTLLNYCGLRRDAISYVVDRNPYKQQCYMPGSHIPIYPVEKILDGRPDYLVILPWNLAEEIMQEMEFVRTWGCRFVLPIPHVQVL